MSAADMIPILLTLIGFLVGGAGFLGVQVILQGQRVAALAQSIADLKETMGRLHAEGLQFRSDTIKRLERIEALELRRVGQAPIGK